MLKFLLSDFASNLNIGTVDLSDIMARINGWITKTKEQGISRKDILKKVKKWKFAM
jgi:hypothetical protein